MQIMYCTQEQNIWKHYVYPSEFNESFLLYLLLFFVKLECQRQITLRLLYKGLNHKINLFGFSFPFLGETNHW